MESHSKHIDFFCSNIKRSFDARWESDTAYRLRWINADGAIGVESFSGKWVWLNVYSGNRLLDASELANLQLPKPLEEVFPMLEGMGVAEQITWVNEVLDTLTELEREVLEQRFGLKDGFARTLEEVGRQFEVTRERIQEIEAKALRKMRHPSRIRKLKDVIKLPEDPKPSRSESEKNTTASEPGPASEGGLEDLLKDEMDANE